MRIVFMGTPEFAVPSLRAMVKAGHAPVAVVTAPDKPRGRGQKVAPPAVKKAAVELGIETIVQPESVTAPDFAKEVEALRPDLLVVVAFRILPPEVFSIPTKGAFNLHGSLLPRYRGAAPIHRAVMAGDTLTGVTTFFLQEKVDTGGIILQRAMTIGPDETTGEVHDRMMHLGASAVVETINLIKAGQAEVIPQDDAMATPAPKVFRAQAGIPWSLTAEQVHNHIRGLSPVPGAWTTTADGLLKVYRARISEGIGRPGQVVDTEGKLVVACGKGAVELLEVQSEGRKRVSAADFLRGAKLEQGDTLQSDIG